MSSKNTTEIKYPLFRNLGDSALLVVAGNSVSPPINSQVRGLITEIRKKDWPGIQEMVPSYSSLVIHFNPLVLSVSAIESLICDVWDSAATVEGKSGKIISIPTI